MRQEGLQVIHKMAHTMGNTARRQHQYPLLVPLPRRRSLVHIHSIIGLALPLRVRLILLLLHHIRDLTLRHCNLLRLCQSPRHLKKERRKREHSSGTSLRRNSRSLSPQPSTFFRNLKNRRVRTPQTHRSHLISALWIPNSQISLGIFLTHTSQNL